jgi:hypothetical protein
MATHSGFTWDASKFENPKKMEEKLRRSLFGICKYWDGPVEAHMKTKAPWKDRTGNARSGLAAQAVKESDDVFSIVMTYSVDYGIWLELANDKNYATLVPTLIVYAPKVISMTTKLLDRLGKV